MALASGAGLAKVGVEAVVGSLKTFKDGFNFMNDQLDKFSGKVKGLGKIFQPVNRLIGGFFESLRRIGEFIVAGLIIRGIERITEALINAAKEAFNTAAAFQDLRIRLQRFIAIDIAEELNLSSVTLALDDAVEPAKDLFVWLSKIAVTSPFDIQDVADTLTMAKTFGFATDEAKTLTESIIDFTAGMGLSGDSMERIIRALGQMKSIGRVTGQELLQLSNAGVPVEDILQRVADNAGITRKELEKLRQEGLIPATEFFQAFNDVIGFRFEGASKQASKSIKAVLGNVKDLTQNVLGFNIALPILDVFSGKLTELVEAFAEGPNFDRFWEATERIGESLKNMVQSFFILLDFDAETFAGGVIDWLENLAGKLETVALFFQQFAIGVIDFDTLAQGIGRVFNIDPAKIDKFIKFVEFIRELPEIFGRFKTAWQEHGIAGIFEELRNIGVPDPILNFLGGLVTTLSNIKLFFDENGEAIKGHFDDLLTRVGQAMGVVPSENESTIEKLGNIIRTFGENLVENGPVITEKLGGIVDAIAGEDGLVDSFDRLLDWVNENEDHILEFMENVGLGMLAFYTFTKIMAVAAALFAAIVFDVTGTAVGFKEDLKTTFGDRPFWLGLGFAVFDALSFGMISGILAMISSVKRLLGIQSPSSVFKRIGEDIMEGLKSGILAKAVELARIAVDAVRGIVSAVQGFLGMDSPSKLFEEIGKNTMEGLAIGVSKGQVIPLHSMMGAMSALLQPAMSPVNSGVVNNNTNTNNFNLNVVTQAKAEPIIADFRMLESLAGGR